MYAMRKEFLEKLYINPRARSVKVTEIAGEAPVEKTEKVASETVNNTKGKSYDFN